MPHAVLDRELDLAAYAQRFEPLVVRDGSDVLRVEQAYLERDARALLLDALVVESGRKTPFYVKVSLHERGTTTVRVDPMTHPDRSPGVHRLVAEVAAELLRFDPSATLLRGNIVIPSDAPGPREEPS